MDDTHGASILIVDDAAENLRILTRILTQSGYVSRPVPSGKLAIEAAIADTPDLILMDMHMPEMSGIDVCRWLKQDDRLKSIPVIFISGLLDTDSIVEAFRVGATDYISKPFKEEEVLARIKTHLRLRQLNVELITHNQVLEQLIAENVRIITASQLATIFALAKLAETRDDDTGHHIERVQTFSRLIAVQMREMGMYAEQLTFVFIDTLFQTAALHDIGKVGIPDAILLKPGKLTEWEFAEMKKHCELGSNTLAEVQKRFPENQFLRMGVDIARSHQEKWDGSGYPDGLSGKKIPLSARIVSLADYYDALTSKRCYRKAIDHESACRMIRDGNDTHFDPDIVSAFFRLRGNFIILGPECLTVK